MDNAKVANKMQALEALPAITWVESDIVAENFTSLYSQTHPDLHKKECEVIYQREALFFKKIMHANAKLNQAARFSLYACFMDVVTNGQTFDPSAGLIYLKVRGFKIGKDDNGKDIWEDRAENKLTAPGELNLRIQLGQILHADVPVVVYESDQFEIGFDGNKKYVIWKSDGTQSGKIKATFMKFTRPDGTIDISFLTANDFERFRIASEKENKRINSNNTANALYTSFNGGIDPGFAATKCMRHGMKMLPKARVIGTNTTLESDDETDETTMVQVAGNQEDAPPSGSPAAAGINTPPPFIDPSGSNVPGPVENKQQGTVRKFNTNF